MAEIKTSDGYMVKHTKLSHQKEAKRFVDTWISPLKGETLKKLSPEAENHLSQFRPNKSVLLHRGTSPENIKSIDRIGYSSWSHDKNVARGWADKKGKITSKRFHPHHILIDFTKAPSHLNGEDFGQSAKSIKEVIIKPH